MEKHGRGKYIGRARVRVPQESLSLDEAIKDAYERADGKRSPTDERNTLGAGD